MPYLKNGEREAFDKILGQIRSIPGGIENPSELNYLMSRIVQIYLNQHGLHYQTINDILGAYTASSKEFYRRVAIPYENEKVAANGDIYD